MFTRATPHAPVNSAVCSVEMPGYGLDKGFPETRSRG